MNDNEVFVHPQGIVEAGAEIGANTRVWAWAHILAQAKIGKDCNICDHTFIENEVVIGDRVTIKCGVYLWNGITIEDDVFVGPNATFTNDKFPRSKQRPAKYCETKICKGASIGANATILPVTIGAGAMVGAGTVVTKDVPPNAIVTGNPASIVGYVGTQKIAPPQTVATGFETVSGSGAKLYDIPRFSDVRGDLNVLEVEKILPFPIRRIFYTYGVSSTHVRGEHAHKTCEQFLIAINGSLNVIVDNGKVRDEFVLDSPGKGLYLPAGCWGTQYKHSPDCILLVCASQGYDASDYIRDYEEFIRYKNGAK